MLTELQKKTAQAIVKIFESGKPLGDYGCVTLLKGDTGHLTYGCSQTTLASGNLALLLHAYCDAGGILSDAMRPYLPAFDRCDVRLDTNEKLKSLLREAGTDPVMKMKQDEFFDRIYWGPALRTASSLGVGSPLGVGVVYDSKIQGSFDRIKIMTDQRQGSVKDIGEEAWIAAYVATRRNWLAGHSNSLLHKTVYRMDTFKEMIDDKKWELNLPLTVRNVVINESLFDGGFEQPAVVDAADTSERVLFLARPRMRGEDVKRLQRALGLSEKETDGIFGNTTDAAVREFQRTRGLKVDGKIGPATRAELGV